MLIEILQNYTEKQITVLNSTLVPGGSKGNVEVRPRLTSQALAPQCKTHPNAQFGELKEPCATLEQKAEHISAYRVCENFFLRCFLGK